MMKRFYIKRIADHVTIVHRPTHQIIRMGSLDEDMKKVIKSYMEMSTEEFYKELNSLGLKFKTNKSYQEDIDKDKEEWYEKAWIFTTKQVLDHFKLKDNIPEEEVPLELIKELQKKDNKVWDIETKEEIKEALEEKEKPKKRTLKKRKKLPKKVKNEKAVIFVPYKSKQEVRRAYTSGKIDLETYKKYMIELKKLEMV